VRFPIRCGSLGSLRALASPGVVVLGVLLGWGLGPVAAPRTASAANGSKPRVPVTWSEGACATVVDRSSTPTVHFEYGVAFEDLGPLTEDEVGDSRTHQFFAFARLDYAAVGTAQRLPPWIAEADITRAAMIDPSVVPEQIEPVDVLETTTRFTASDWVRITADDARVPISDAQAAMGVDWDVSEVPPGAYTIWGYTWEPLTNVWSLRPGFVKVIASATEADAAGPAIALLHDSEVVTVGEPYAVAGCADVPAGSTLDLEWGPVEGPVEPAWQPLVDDAPIATGMLALEITLPPEAAGEGFGEKRVRLRATVTDPSGNAYVAYSPGAYEVVAAEAEADEGCACTSTRPGSPERVSIVLVVLAWRRRARTDPTARRRARP
jgi:hypothetical protein